MLSLINGWETTRYELLSTRICDLQLKVQGSPLEPHLSRLYRELSRKKLQFRPNVYLTDGWGCPDGVPVIGVPFYLASRELMRLEEEQTGEIEDARAIMMYLRHEAGHAINYAYRLFERDDWTETFGQFTLPYKDSFRPDPDSREFVRHLNHQRYGRTYAQKHPDEDFAETFAVWLTPRSNWRQRYRTWPAIRKLRYVDRLMKEIRDADPLCTDGALVTPVEEMTVSLAEYYGKRAERYRDQAQGYVDDKLREAFPETRSRKLQPAWELIQKHRAYLRECLLRWARLDPQVADAILDKLETRSSELGLSYPARVADIRLRDLHALVTALGMNFAFTGRLTG
ncbi:MAG: hypothetical protein C4297_14110 [Gemmataceae bacterium]